MVIGTLAGAATLGLMIPPSLTLIVYGVSINESIAKLFMAGVLPGLVLAGDVHGLCRHLSRRSGPSYKPVGRTADVGFLETALPIPGF